jgi:hypothetical protein
MAVVEKDGGIILRNYLYAVDIGWIYRFHMYLFSCVLKENMEPPGARLPFVCLNHKEQTHLSKSFCCNSSLCNGQAEIELDPPTTPSPTTTNPSLQAPSWWMIGSPLLVAVVAVCVPLCCILIVIIFYLLYRYRLFFPHVVPVNKAPWQLCDGYGHSCPRVLTHLL